MADAERIQKVREKMNWGRPTECTICGDSMVKAFGFIHLRKSGYRTTANHYICRKCLAVAAEELVRSDDHSTEEEEVQS